MSETVDARLKRLGKVLKVFRASRSMNQDELAVRAGISKSHMWALEAGKKEPGVITLLQLASALNVNCCVLLMALDDNCDMPTQGQLEMLEECFGSDED